MQPAGILLTPTGVDANGSLFPLAYAVVDAENDANWFWFLEMSFKHKQCIFSAMLIARIQMNLSFFQIGKKVSSKALIDCFLIHPMRTASVISKTTCTSSSNTRI